MENISAYRLADLNRNLSIMGVRPLDVLVVGATGAGKSSTINALFQKEAAKVGYGTDPETMEVTSWNLNESFRLWDSPGLGDSVTADRMHSRKLTEQLYQSYPHNGNTYGIIDLVLVLLDGSSRDLGTAYKLLNEVILPNFQTDRILVAVNQADRAMGGRHWNDFFNEPDPELLSFLKEKAVSVQRRIREATGVQTRCPVFFSAEKGYHIDELMNLIIDNMPKEKRPLV